MKAADKHRSVWLDIHPELQAATHTSAELITGPSGNQWAETHLGARPLVISLISLPARPIWPLSAGQWPGPRGVIDQALLTDR